MTQLTDDVKIETAHGSVSRSRDTVAIEYRPESSVPVPVDVLTGGAPSQRIGGGGSEDVVTFWDAIALRGRRTTPSVKLQPDRPGLIELHGIAVRLKAEIVAARDAANADGATRAEADREARCVEFASTLPAGLVRIEQVDHDLYAADGWGSIEYRHGGHKLDMVEVSKLDPQYLRHPDGGKVEAAWVDGDALAAIVARLDAAKARRNAANAEAEAAAKVDLEAKAAEAARTGKPVAVESWTEACDDPDVGCSLDVVVRLVNPDGSHSHKRTHTY